MRTWVMQQGTYSDEYMTVRSSNKLNSPGHKCTNVFVPIYWCCCNLYRKQDHTSLTDQTNSMFEIAFLDSQIITLFFQGEKSNNHLFDNPTSKS